MNRVASYTNLRVLRQMLERPPSLMDTSIHPLPFLLYPVFLHRGSIPSFRQVESLEAASDAVRPGHCILLHNAAYPVFYFDPITRQDTLIPTILYGNVDCPAAHVTSTCGGCFASTYVRTHTHTHTHPPTCAPTNPLPVLSPRSITATSTVTVTVTAEGWACTSRKRRG